MGGKSSKQTIGYWYDMDVLATFAHEVHEVIEIRVGDRTAWVGSIIESGTRSIYKDELFGGEKREGGVYGQVDFMFGESDLPVNEFLGSSMRKTGIAGPVPAYRNTFNLFFRGVDAVNAEFSDSGVFTKEASPPPLVTNSSGFALKPKVPSKAFRWSALNPYFKPFKIKARRYTKDWHPEIAKIETVLNSSVTGEEFAGALNTDLDTAEWHYLVESLGSSNNYSGDTNEFISWSSGTFPFGDNKGPLSISSLGFRNNISTIVPIDTKVWIKRFVYVNELTSDVPFNVFFDNGFSLWINGVLVYNGYDTHSASVSFVIPKARFRKGRNTVSMLMHDDNDTWSGDRFVCDITGLHDASTVGDMNPAHIIRECLTNTEWGMGYPTADIDDTRFYAVAQALYDEGFGISLRWTQQSTIEDFIMLVLRHINGVVTQDRSTGKIFIKLIRDDYSVGSLTVLDQTNSNLVSYSRATGDEIVNEVTLKYTNADGVSDAITVHDLAGLFDGQIKSQEVDLPGIRNPELAARVAQRELESRIKPIAKLTITTDRRAFHLYEGDVFNFTWIDHGISNMVCRILSMDMGSLEDNKITIEAVQDVFGLPATSYVKPTYSDWVNPVTPLTASPYRYITETPYYDIARTMSTADLDYLEPTDCYIDVFAKEASTDALGYNLWTAAGSADVELRTTASYAAMTTLTAALVREETSVLEVADAGNIAYLIESGNACVIVNGEYMHITDYDTDANTITVNRGALDTVPIEHAIGDTVILTDASAGQDEISYIPTEIVKVKAQTHSSSGDLAIASTPEDTYTINQRQARPYAPGQVRVNGVAYPENIGLGDGLNLTWKHRNRLTQTASIIDQSTGTITPEVGTDYVLRIYGDTDVLLRTVNTGLTGESYNYTTALEAADGGGSVVDTGDVIDPWWDKTKLLLNFNGANASTTFVDSSPNFATVFGDARISTAQSKFGGASGYFDGNGDYLRFPSSVAFDLGTTYTVECWVYATSLSSNFGIVHRGYYNTSGQTWTGLTFSIRWLTTNALRFYFYGVSFATEQYIDVSAALVVNTWVHIAMVRNSTSGTVFINGVSAGTISGLNTPAVSSQDLRIGAWDYSANIEYFTGYIDDLRITKGVARYTTAFTPPASELGKYAKPADFNQTFALFTAEPEPNDPYYNTGEHVVNYAIGNIASLNPYGGAEGAYFRAPIVTTDSKFGTRCLGDGGFLYEQDEFNIHYSPDKKITFDFWAKIHSSMTDTVFGHHLFGAYNRWKIGFIKNNGSNPVSMEFGTIDQSDTFKDWFSLSGTTTLDTWVHYAIVLELISAPLDTAQVTVYRNGNQVGTGVVNYSDIVGVTEPRIGDDYPDSNQMLFDEFRIRHGAAYTTNFTPPTTSSYAIDPNWSDTTLLMNFNGSNGSVEMENIAEFTKTLTTVGNAQISTAQSKFGGASGYFDGTGDYLSISSPNDFTFGTGDFTIETWFYIAGNSPLDSQGKRVASLWCPSVSIAAFQLFIDGDANTTGTGISAWNSITSTLTAGSTSINHNIWNHVAFVRSNGVIKIYLNGVSIASGTFSSNFSNVIQPNIGFQNETGLNRFFNGYLDDYRVTRGARYLTDFTPPVSQLAKLTSGIDPQWDNVSVMLNFNGTNASTTFTDSSPNAVAMTAVGNAQISTVQSRFGGASGYFDGTGDYLTTSSSSKYSAASGDITIEAWVRPASLSSIRTIASKHPSGGATATEWVFYTNPSAQVAFVAWNSSGSVVVNTVGTTTMTVDTWYHVAIVRKDTTWYLFLNGNLEASATESGTIGSNSALLYVGFDASSAAGGTRGWHGYIDDFRITKNFARYTATFTPPNYQLGEIAYSTAALNSQLRFELEARRDGLTSWMMHNHTVVRA